MKKRLFMLLTAAMSIALTFAQTYEKDYYAPFFETATYQGAFAPVGQGSTKITLYGQTIKMANGNDWVLNSPGNWLQDWTNWDPQNTIYPGDAAYVSSVSGAFVDGGTKTGDITSNTTWGADGQKTLIKISGAIHVTNGATLTIKKNTIIRGDASNISFLLIGKGAKLYAIGTPDQPIIFTSIKAPGQRTSGDWAGFLLMGKSQNNTSPNGTGVRNFEALPTDPLSEYGGGANFDIHDNSGECRFLRVEFAGYNYLPDQEINGVTFGAVGDQTRFDFCQVSFSRDDSFEWFGGTPNHKYLVAWAGIDDDFDQDEGYQGKLQFCLGVRKYDVFETSAGGTSHGFEHDNNTGLGTSAQNVTDRVNPQPSTRPRLSNITMVGPRIGSSSNIPQITGNRFGAGMAFRTGDESCVYNTVIIGYPRQWELYHNSASLIPSAHQKLIGVSDAANYVPNEVRNTLLIKDALDARSGLSAKGANGVPNGIVEQQQVPTTATDLTLNKGAYFGANDLYLSGGTLMDDAGFPTWLNQSVSLFNNTFTSAVTATDIFNSPFYWNGSSIVVPDYSLKAGYGLNYDFSSSYLSLNSLAGVGAFNFIVAPATLPTINAPTGSPSAAFTINALAFGLTGTGISVGVSDSHFQISSDGGSTWSASSLPVTGGSVWVRLNSTTDGSFSGNVTFTPADGRAPAQSVAVSGQSIKPAVPFVVASQAILADFTTQLINSESNWQSFTIAGNLLSAPVTVTSPVNFEISSDGSTFTTSPLMFTPVYRQLTPTVIYVKYKPTGSTANGGTDAGSITVASNGAVTESVVVNGTWGVNLQVGPLDPNDNSKLIQFISVPSFPSFISYTGVPSPSQVSYVKATGLPVGQNVIVNALGGLQFSYDNATFSNGPLTFAGTAGTLAPTPFYVRYKGTGSLGVYGTTGGNVVAVGLQGTTAYDKFIGLQGVTENKPSALVGTITGVTTNTVTATGAAFTTKLAKGVAFYIGGLASTNFVGIVSSIVSDTVVVLDRTVTASAGAAIGATATNATMINVQANNWESNKDFNRGALWFPTGTLNSDASAFNVASQQSGVMTVSGFSPLTAFVGRDYSTEYTLRYEVSLDNSTWTDIVSIAGTNGVITPTLVYVRYNPGSSISGHVAGNPAVFTLPNPPFGQHTGSILVGSSANTATLASYTGSTALGTSLVMTGGVILYTVGYSDPILYASSTPLPAYPGIADVNSGLTNLFTVANTPSISVPVYVWATRLQSDITVLSPSTNFELSKDGVTNWTSSITLTKDANSNFQIGATPAYYVRFNPLNSTDNKSANISVAATKVSQNVNVNGFAVDTPPAFINVSTNNLYVQSSSVSTFTVSGGNIAYPVTITAPAGFQVWSGSGSYSNTVSLAPNTLNYGDLAPTAVLVTFTGTTSVTGELLSLASGNASIVSVTLTGGIVSAIDDEVLVASSVVVYPNPTEGSATLAVDFAGAEKIAVNVYDVTGTSLLYFTSAVSGVAYYPISGLTPGLYIIQVSTSKTVKRVKLIVK